MHTWIKNFVQLQLCGLWKVGLVILKSDLSETKQLTITIIANYCHCDRLWNIVTVIACELLSLWSPVKYCHCDRPWSIVTVIAHEILSLWSPVKYCHCDRLWNIVTVIAREILSLWSPVKYCYYDRPWNIKSIRSKQYTSEIANNAVYFNQIANNAVYFKHFFFNIFSPQSRRVMIWKN